MLVKRIHPGYVAETISKFAQLLSRSECKTFADGAATHNCLLAFDPFNGLLYDLKLFDHD